MQFVEGAFKLPEARGRQLDGDNCPFYASFLCPDAHIRGRACLRREHCRRIWFVFFVLDTRAIKILCNHCHKPIITNTPWVCGFCQENNNHTDNFPFIHRCEHCGAEPKAYKCHHCGELIFLTDDQLKANFASCIGTEVKAVPPPQAPDESELQQREMQNLKNQIILTQLHAELKKEKRIEESLKKKSPEEEAEERLGKHVAGDIAVFTAARRVRLKYNEEFKDDPELLKKINLSVDQFLEEQP